MKNARLIGALLVCVILSGAGAALAQDWPQWRGPNRDGKVTGFAAPETWPQALALKWSATVGSGDSSPALVGDKLYVCARQGEDEVTLCLDASNGKEIWSDKYAAQAVTGAAARAHPGLRGSPAVADGKVVTVGVGGVVSCLDAAKGTLVWRKDEFPKIVPKFFSGTSPIIVDGMAIAYPGGEGNGALVAFDLAKGDVKWKWAGEGPGYSSPVVMTVDGVKQVVTLSEKSVVGVGLADGKLLWQVAFVPKGMSYNAATPIVDGQTVYVTGQGRGTKALKIAKTAEGFGATELWSNDKVAVQFNTPVLKDGLLFGLTDKGLFFCLDAKSGETKWTDSVSRGKGFAAMLDAGSVILALPDSSELTAIKPDGSKYTELAKIKVARTPTYATPIIAGKKVFVKDADSVTMWTFE